VAPPGRRPGRVDTEVNASGVKIVREEGRGVAVHRRSFALLLCVVTGATVGCRPDGRALSDAEGDVLRVVDSPAPLHRAPRPIGDVDLTIHDDATPLTDVVGATRLTDGRIVVADAAVSTLYYFSAEGEPFGSFGRPGDGPSEFRVLQSIGRLAGDTVWAYDFSSNRFTFVSPEGGLARTVRLRPPVGPGLAVGVLSSGDLVVGESWSPTAMAAATEPGLVRPDVAYLRYGPAGALVDTFATVPGRESWVSVEDGRPVMGMAPIGRSAVHALADERLVVGDETAYEVLVVGPEGPPLVVRWSGPDPSVTPEVVRLWRDARTASAEPRERARFERALAEVEMPERLPTYQRILSSPDGGFWVGSYEPDAEGSREWQVFDATGRWLGTMTAPPRFRVLDVGDDRVLGVSIDELGVPTVESRSIDPFEG
jgi:hypothetical protein